MTKTYTARYIFPATSPPLERGTITVEGERIVAVEPHGVRTPDVDLGDTAIIPGLVNAHTHLDLSGARGKIPPTDPERFTDWLMGVIEYRKSRTPQQVQEDIHDGLSECLKSGTTLLGDIAAAFSSWEPLQTKLIRSVMFMEQIGLSQEKQHEYAFQLCHRMVSHPSTQMSRYGISPHAPYSAGAKLINQFPCANPKSIHFAESPFEQELLQQRTGPFITFLRKLNVHNYDDMIGSWESCLEITSSHHQREILKSIYENNEIVHHFLSTPILLVHCNYLSINTKFASNQHVIYCPRTHAAFKHPRHPFADFLARDINVALGTDSLASNPDLDLFAEARHVYHHRKDVSGETILKMATINGAKALGFENDCGSLEPGKSADFVVMPLSDDLDPCDALFNAPDGNRRTLYRGEWREDATGDGVSASPSIGL